MHLSIYEKLRTLEDSSLGFFVEDLTEEDLPLIKGLGSIQFNDLSNLTWNSVNLCTIPGLVIRGCFDIRRGYHKGDPPDFQIENLSTIMNLLGRKNNN